MAACRRCAAQLEADGTCSSCVARVRAAIALEGAAEYARRRLRAAVDAIAKRGRAS